MSGLKKWNRIVLPYEIASLATLGAVLAAAGENLTTHEIVPDEAVVPIMWTGLLVNVAIGLAYLIRRRAYIQDGH